MSPALTAPTPQGAHRVTCSPGSHAWQVEVLSDKEELLYCVVWKNGNRPTGQRHRQWVITERSVKWDLKYLLTWRRIAS